MIIKAKKEIGNKVVAMLCWASKLVCKSCMQNAQTLNKEYRNQQEVFCHYQTTVRLYFYSARYNILLTVICVTIYFCFARSVCTKHIAKDN